MPKLNLQIPHELGTDEALKRVKNLLTNLKQEQGDSITIVKEEWNGNKASFAFNAKGFDLSGEMEVMPASVDIEADVPFAVSLFSGVIKGVIEGKAKELLEK